MPFMIVPEIAQVLPEIGALCEHQGVERMSLFGSATTKDFSPETSDVDCLIKFSHSGKPDLADRYFDLVEGLEHTLRRSVDIVFEGYMRNPIFLKLLKNPKC